MLSGSTPALTFKKLLAYLISGLRIDEHCTRVCLLALLCFIPQ